MHYLSIHQVQSKGAICLAHHLLCGGPRVYLDACNSEQYYNDMVQLLDTRYCHIQLRLRTDKQTNRQPLHSLTRLLHGGVKVGADHLIKLTQSTVSANK